MSYLDEIYKNLPWKMQNIGISLYGYFWKKRRFGGIFKNEVESFKKRESYNFDEWAEYQDKELHRLLLHAFDSVPYYKEKYTKAGLRREDLARIKTDDISRIPYLEKDELRKFGKNLLLSEARDKNGSFFASSGSTGTPTQIYFSIPFHQKWSAAFESRIRNWAGVTRFDSRGMIGGRRILPKGFAKPPFYRYNYFEKQVYFSAYHITKHTAIEYLKGIRKYKIDYMTGYAVSNYILAKHFQQSGYEIPPLKAVITSSEKLSSEMRACLESVYQCNVYDSYSGVEACGLISENEYGQLLISPDVGLVEVIKSNGEKADFGEEGELVCTGLLNFDQPLIRYRIGDSVKLSKVQKTKCGRSMIIVDEIVGRVEDSVIGPDGREMVRFHGIFNDISSIIKGQIVQNSLKKFDINIEVDIPLTKSEEQLIIRRMNSQLGQVNIIINEVSEIPLGPNGKFKSVVSKYRID